MQHVQKLVAQNQFLLQKLNNGTADQQEIRKQLSVITNQRIDSSVEVRLPFYTDFGRNIHLGKNIFINSGVMITDLGGVYIGNNVLIGPKVTIATVNHPLNPQDRHHVDLKPFYIRQNAWIGTNAVIVPGITISENAVVAAGSVVTHNVPKDTMVAGVPSRITKPLK